MDNSDKTINELVSACTWALDALLGLEKVYGDDQFKSKTTWEDKVDDHINGACACAITQLREVLAKHKEVIQ